MKDDDDFLPTRSGTPQGKSFENRLIRHAGGPNTIARRERQHADGSRTVMKTRAGHPHFWTEDAPGEESAVRQVRFVGEPYYTAGTEPPGFPETLVVYRIKVDVPTAKASLKQISDAEYRGTDSTENWKKYFRNLFWKEPALNGKYLRAYTLDRVITATERFLPETLVELSVDGTLSTVDPSDAYAYGFHTMTFGGVTKPWLLCDYGVINWPTDGSVTPFNTGNILPGWIGYEPGTYWDNWYGLNLSYCFFSGDGKYLVFAGTMPIVGTSPVTYGLNGVYAYDVDANTMTAVATETWNDTLSVSMDTSYAEIPAGSGLYEPNSFSNSVSLSLVRNIPIGAGCATGDVVPVCLHCEYSVSATNYGSRIASHQLSNTRSDTYTQAYQLKIGAAVVYSKNITYEFTGISDLTTNSWGFSGRERSVFGVLAHPESDVLVLIETNVLQPEFFITSGDTQPVPVTRVLAHVLDTRKQLVRTVVGKDVNLPSLAPWDDDLADDIVLTYSTAVGDRASMSFSSSTPISNTTTEVSPVTGKKFLFASGWAQHWNPTTHVFDSVSPEDLDENWFSPFSFDSNPSYMVTAIGAVAATKDMVVCSIKHPYLDDYFLNFAMDRKTGAVDRFSPDHGFTNLYSIERAV